MAKSLPSIFSTAASVSASAVGAWALMCLLDKKKTTGVTASLPFFVSHPGADPDKYNEGFGNNPGVLIEPVKPLAATKSGKWSLGWGLVPGSYRNSHHKDSHVAALKLKTEYDVTKRIFLESGSYLGGVTGYRENVTPGVLFYVGVGVNVTDKFFLGLRLKWIPAKTLGGHSADSVNLALNVGRRPS